MKCTPKVRVYILLLGLTSSVAGFFCAHFESALAADYARIREDHKRYREGSGIVRWKCGLWKSSEESGGCF